jgi:hypothetical protein
MLMLRAALTMLRPKFRDTSPLLSETSPTKMYQYRDACSAIASVSASSIER